MTPIIKLTNDEFGTLMCDEHGVELDNNYCPFCERQLLIELTDHDPFDEVLGG
jgi:hypothetical protein